MCIGFLGFHNKWFKTTEIYSFTVWEAKSLKSRYWQGCAPSEGSRGQSVPCLFWLLVVVGISCDPITPPVFASVFTCPSLFLNHLF